MKPAPHDLRVDPVRARAETEEGPLVPFPMPQPNVFLAPEHPGSTGFNEFPMRRTTREPTCAL